MYSIIRPFKYIHTRQIDTIQCNTNAMILMSHKIRCVFLSLKTNILNASNETKREFKTETRIELRIYHRYTKQILCSKSKWIRDLMSTKGIEAKWMMRHLNEEHNKYTHGTHTYTNTINHSESKKKNKKKNSLGL